MKKRFTLVLVCLLLMGLAACSGGDSSAADAGGNSTAGGTAEAAPTAEGGIKVGFTAMNLTSEFHIAAANRIEELCKENGYEFTSVDGNSDNQRQINAIEDMITGGIDVLVLCPVSQDGILPALEACADAGVLVVGYDSIVTDTQYLESYIASDNYQAGYITGQYLVDNFPEGGTLAIIDNQRAESVVARVNGLLDAIEGSDIEVVARDNIQSASDVMNIVEDTLQRYPDLTFYWALNDDCALIACGTIQTAGADTLVIGVDGNPSGKEAIQTGSYMATAAQSPIAIAEQVFAVIQARLAGEAVEAEYLIDTFMIDAGNVDEYGTDSWQ